MFHRAAEPASAAHATDAVMLLHIPNVLTRDELVHLRTALDAADWTDGRETVGTLGAQVKRNQQLLQIILDNNLPQEGMRIYPQHLNPME